MQKQFYVYILSNKSKTLYIGVTSDINKRIWEHKNNIVKGFTKKYNIHNLVYYEIFESSEAAIKREKQLKNWKREWKIDLINKFNNEWKDLYEEIYK